MTTFGLNYEGFVLKRLSDIKTELETLLKSAFGPNINLNSASVFGQFVGIMAYAFAVKWELAQDVWESFDPDKADGVSLDAICALTNTVRIAAQPTTVAASVIGTIGAVIPAGSKASNADSMDTYSLDEAVTISSDNAIQSWISVDTVADETDYTITIDGTYTTITSGVGATEISILSAFMSAINSGIQATAEFDGTELVITTIEDPIDLSVSANLSIGTVGCRGMFSADETGKKLLPVGKLTEIETPVAGWSEVINLEAGLTGRARENDEELRARRKLNINVAAQHTVESLFSRLSSLLNVKDVKIYQNSGATEDVYGTPPQHIWAIVYGGSDQHIADSMFAVVPGGIGMRGLETVNVTSSITSQVYQMRFDRPVVIEAYITMSIEVLTDDFPTDGVKQIKEALVAFGEENQTISEPLIYNKLYLPIYSIHGHAVLSLYLGTEENPTGTTTLDAALNQVIEITEDRIEVTIV